MNMLTGMQIAEALCKANPYTGVPYDKVKGKKLTVQQRAQNLLDVGYVHEGDPYGWGGDMAAGTILMEPKGCPKDCPPPMNYYGNGMEVGFKASALMGTHYIEYINTAVACVYPV
jgi:hypothetical protein